MKTRQKTSSPGALENSENPRRPASTRTASDSGDLYSVAAGMYDRINLSVSFGNGYRYRDEQVRSLGIRSGDHLLDVGSGTGVLARSAMELVGEDGRVLAVDPCREMLEIARNSGVTETVIGSIDKLPAAADEFDFVTTGYSLRYARSIEEGLGEIWRVLKPGGKVLILEITPPANPLLRALTGTYILIVARVIALIATRSLGSRKVLGHLWNEIRTTPQPDAFIQSLESSGFGDCQCHRKHGMLTAYTAIKQESA